MGPDDHLFITDPATGRVVERNALGQLLAVEDGFQQPLAIAVDAAGRRYLSEQTTGSVGVFDADWTLLFKLGAGDGDGDGDGTGEFASPIDIALDPADGSVYVADGGNHTIEVYDSSGRWARTLGGQGSGAGQFEHPGAVHVSAAGEVWVADQNNDRIQVLDKNGTLQRCFGHQSGEARKFGRIQDLVEDSAGRFYAADAFHGHVKVLDGQGVELTTLAGFGEGAGELTTPSGLAMDSSQRLFVASHGNGRVEVFGIDDYSDPFDASPPGNVQFALAAYQGLESSGSLAVEVTRSGGNSGLITVGYATADAGARAGSDYTATTGSLSFADGDTAPKTIQVPLIDDGTYEGSEILSLTLRAPVGGELGSPSAAALSILDDEPNSPGTLQFASPAHAVAENGAPITFTVTRTGGTVGSVQVSYGPSGGTATAGLDYTIIGDKLFFGHEDSTPKSFQVVLVDDALSEGDELVTLALSQPIGGAAIGDPGSAVLTILDDEAPPCPVTLQLTGEVVATTELFTATQSIAAGDPGAPFRVVAGGVAELRAGASIVLNQELAIEAGGSLALVVDPNACAGGV